MELDKRIEALTDILSVTVGCHDWELMTKKGYFANSIFDFKDLKRLCVYGEYAGWREHNQCFLCKQAGDETYYSYFLPEDRLLPKEPEKKYRPFSIEEWKFKHSFGDTILYRRKGTYCGWHREAETMYLGYVKQLNGITDEAGKGELILGDGCYDIQNLFDNYEIWIDGGWQPFGIIDD